MDQGEWNGFSPNKSDSTPYYEINDQLNERKAQFNDNDQYLLHQLEQNMYEHNNPEKLEDFNLDGYQFVLPDANQENHGQQVHQENNPNRGSSHAPTPTSIVQAQMSQIEGIGFADSNSATPLTDGSQFSANTPQQTNSQSQSSQQQQQPQLQQQQQQQQQQQGRAHSHTYSNSSSQSNSTAFPPANSVQNTPSMLPNKQHLMNGNQVVSSPILPSQNDKSFNNQHYYHKLSRSKSKELYEHHHQSQHVRPDVVFTPLVSPHDTPLDSKQKYSNPLQTSFEPLTSPALNAHNETGKRRTSSSAFAGVDENKPATYKRRTPHGTPVMQGNNNYNNQNYDGQQSSKSPGNFEKLPETSYSSEYNSNSNSTYGTPMLPPQSFKKIDNGSSTYKKTGKGSSTSPQLMGFTMGKLAKQQEEQTTNGTNDTQSYQGSPVLRSRKSSFNSSKSSDTSPNLAANSGYKKEKPPTKKASHKLAEQGRRNRMNMAVQSLGLLIPQSYHDQVAIPSKATTVELASQYIKDLLGEIDRMKR